MGCRENHQGDGYAGCTRCRLTAHVSPFCTSTPVTSQPSLTDSMTHGEPGCQGQGSGCQGSAPPTLGLSPVGVALAQKAVLPRQVWMEEPEGSGLGDSTEPPAAPAHLLPTQRLPRAMVGTTGDSEHGTPRACLPLPETLAQPCGLPAWGQELVRTPRAPPCSAPGAEAASRGPLGPPTPGHALRGGPSHRGWPGGSGRMLQEPSGVVRLALGDPSPWGPLWGSWITAGSPGPVRPLGGAAPAPLPTPTRGLSRRTS